MKGHSLTFSSLGFWSRSKCTRVRLSFRARAKAIKPPVRTRFCLTSRDVRIRDSARNSASTTAPETKPPSKTNEPSSQGVLIIRTNQEVGGSVPSHVIPTEARPSLVMERLLMSASFSVCTDLFCRSLSLRSNVDSVLNKG